MSNTIPDKLSVIITFEYTYSDRFSLFFIYKELSGLV